jgi:predicted helicase
MNPSGRFDPIKARQTLVKRGNIAGHVVRYAYRPFDVRWVYWEPETKLLDEKRSEYWPHVAPTNVFLSAGERNRKEVFYQPQIVRALADHHLVESNVALLPLELNGGNGAWRPNLPQPLLDYLAANKLRPSDVFNHIVAVLHAPAYHRENAGALRMDWPRVPLPIDPTLLASSSELGVMLTALLDSDTPASGVSVALRPGLSSWVFLRSAAASPWPLTTSPSQCAGAPHRTLVAAGASSCPAQG